MTKDQSKEWVLVPVEPTYEMGRAWLKTEGTFEQQYAAMLAARPQPAQPEQASQPTQGDAPIELHHSDLLIEPWPPQPSKGMIVGMSKGVKITHRPTGVSVTCDDERSQHKNRDIALERLRAALTHAHHGITGEGT